MEDFTFKVNLVAVVRVRAGDKSVARKIVPTVLHRDSGEFSAWEHLYLRVCKMAGSCPPY
jgi:hypothetical protein